MVIACGKGSKNAQLLPSDPNITLTAQLEGAQVVIDVACKGSYLVWYEHIQGDGTACEPSQPAKFSHSLTELGSAGEHELVIAAKNQSKGDHFQEASDNVVKIAVPADVLGAQLVIAGCGGGSGSNVHISIAGAATPTSCALEPNFTTKLKLTAPPGVDVAIGKKGYIAPPSGPLDVEVDLGDGLLDQSRAEIVDPSKKMSIAWHVGAGAGKLSIDIDRPGPAVGQWLREGA